MVILTVLVALYFSVCTFAVFTFSRRGKHAQFDLTPASFGLEYQKVFFNPRGDDIRLAAWYVPNEEASSAIILAHGRDACKQNAISGNMPALCAELHDAGFAVLAIDQRGHGESEGIPCGNGSQEGLDVLGAADWLIAQGFAPGRIGALGISMGADACIIAAANDPALGAIAVESAFADLELLINQSWKKLSGLPKAFLPGVYLMGRIILGYDFRDIQPVVDIKNIPPRPILILHCAEDEDVDVGHAYLLKEAVPQAQLVVLDQCEHGEMYRDQPEAYLDLVIPFFKQGIDF